MTVYKFGEFVFNPVAEVLSKNGKEVKIRPQTSQILHYFISHRDRLVTREELVEAVWAGEFVNDQAVFQSVNLLRKALGENPREPKFLKTVPRKGYQWICPVAESKPVPAPAAFTPTQPQPILSDTARTEVVKQSAHARNSRWRQLVAGLVVFLMLTVLIIRYTAREEAPIVAEAEPPALPAPTRIVFLPFENASGDPEKQWVELGLMDMTGRLLDLRPQTHVSSTERVLKALKERDLERGTPDSPEVMEDLRKALNADWLVTATIQGEEGAWRLDYQMRDARGGLRSGQITQPDLSETARMLDHRLSGLLEKDYPGQRYDVLSSDPVANEHYAMAVQFNLKGESQKARTYFEIAKAKDPNFLWAGLQLAQVLSYQGEIELANHTVSEIEERGEFKDPFNAELLRLKGDLATNQEQYEAASNYYHKAREIWLDLEDRDQQAGCLIDLAFVEGIQDNFEVSRSQYTEAARLYESTGNRYGLAVSKDLLGVAAMQARHFDLARKSWREADIIYGSLAAHEEKAGVLLSLGNLLEEERQIDDAAVLYQQAFDLAQEHNIKPALQESLLNLANAARENKHWKISEDYLWRAMALAKELGDRGGECVVYLDLSDLGLMNKQYVEAATQAQKAVDLAREIGFVMLESSAHLLLTEIRLEQNRPKQARQHFENGRNKARVDDADATLLESELLYAEKRYTEALNTLRRVKVSWPHVWSDAEEKRLAQFDKSAREKGS